MIYQVALLSDQLVSQVVNVYTCEEPIHGELVEYCINDTDGSRLELSGYVDYVVGITHVYNS